MGCLSFDAVKLPLFIHRLPLSPDEPDHELPCVSSQRRVIARAGPVKLSFGDVTEANVLTIGPHGEAKVLLACKLYDDFQVFADAQLRVNPIVARSISIPL